MKRINFLPEGAWNAPAGIAIIVLVAQSFLFTSCSKENALQTSNGIPEPVAASAKLTSAPMETMSVTPDGWYWQCYNANNTGSASLNNGAAGNFSVTYSNVADVVAGKGWSVGAARNIGYNVGSLSGSYNSVGVYGWTTNPLIEYYVTEFGSVVSGSRINTITSDGHTYSFYKHQQVNQPSIIGTATFWQYLDNWGGSSTGSNHSIAMANHINNWKSRGGQGFGSYNYQILAIEAYGNKSGSMNATVWQQ